MDASRGDQHSRSSTTARRGAGSLDRPIFVLAPPAAGGRLLADAIAVLPEAWSATSLSGGLLSGAARYHPPDRAEGNRLTAAQATPAVAERIREALRGARREPGRLVDAAPRNAVMVPFLAEVFPDARFVYVHREPDRTLIDALSVWRAQTAVTHRTLPEWVGPPWSFLLVPGWRALSGRPLAEIVCEQWVRTMRVLVADLEALAPEQWCVVDRQALLAAPEQEVGRLLRFTGLRTERRTEVVLALTPSRGDPDTAARAASELAPYLDRTAPIAAQSRDWLA